MSKDQMKKWIDLFESLEEQETGSDDLNSPLAKEWRETHFGEFLLGYEFPIQAIHELDFQTDLVHGQWNLVGEVSLAEHQAIGMFGAAMNKCLVEVSVGAAEDSSVLHLKLNFSWEYHNGGRNGHEVRYIMKEPGNWEIV